MRVIVVGGGFAAVQFAKTLRKKLRPSECEILLFSRENHMVFHPLLADVAGASINPDAGATPLGQMLPGVGCRTGRVQRIDLSSSEVEFDDGSGVLSRLPYEVGGFLGYKVSRKCVVLAAYRYLSVNYRPNANAQFVYDVDMPGVMVGATINLK